MSQSPVPSVIYSLPYTTLFRSPNIPSPIVSFEGMGTGLPGFTVQSAPPDTSGDIGPNHYVQIVNSATRSEEHTSELQSQSNIVCRLLLEKKNRAIRIPVRIQRS